MTVSFFVFGCLGSNCGHHFDRSMDMPHAPNSDSDRHHWDQFNLSAPFALYLT